MRRFQNSRGQIVALNHQRQGGIKYHHGQPGFGDDQGALNYRSLRLIRHGVPGDEMDGWPTRVLLDL